MHLHPGKSIQKGPKPAARSAGMALPTPTAGSFKTPWPTSILPRLLVPASLCLCQMCSPFPYPMVNEAAVGKYYGSWDRWSAGKLGNWETGMVGCWQHLGVLHESPCGSMLTAWLAFGESDAAEGLLASKSSPDPSNPGSHSSPAIPCQSASSGRNKCGDR